MSKRVISKRYFSRLIKAEKEKFLEKFNNFNEENSEVLQSPVIQEMQSAETDVDVVFPKNIGKTLELKYSLQNKLKDWYIQCNPTRESFRKILRILKSENFDIPLDPETILRNREKIIIRTVAPGEYWHYGIENQLQKISEHIMNSSEIILDIGIDGLPLYKSSGQGLWPILGKITNIKNIKVFLIGTFLGKKKPNDINNYLHDFEHEVKILLEHGIKIANRVLTFKIRAFICDAPAGAFVRGIVGHNALNGCNKCDQIGRSVENVVTFSIISGNTISDQEFSDRKYTSLHKSYKTNQISLEKLGIGMISQFPLDPMHLVDLGVTRKIILSLINGKASEKLNTARKLQISNRLVSLVGFIPKEFSRKPRILDEILKWKATEFRQFILYTGILVLKDIVGEDFYYHFLLLHSAYRLLCCPRNVRSNINTAHDMIKHFVENFPIVHASNSVTYNVHNLLHLTDSIKNTGALDSFSAYDFENYMQDLKRKIKKPTKILQQLSDKLKRDNLTKEEKQFGFKKNISGKIKSYYSDSYFISLTQPNNYCCIHPFTPIKITGFLEREEKFVIGRKLLNLNSFFTEPVDSLSALGICLTETTTSEEDEIFLLSEISYKYMCLPYENNLLLIPVLHGCT